MMIGDKRRERGERQVVEQQRMGLGWFVLSIYERAQRRMLPGYEPRSR
jgi:hypothetical protein